MAAPSSKNLGFLGSFKIYILKNLKNPGIMAAPGFEIFALSLHERKLYIPATILILMLSFNLNSLKDEEKFALFYGIMLGDGCLSQYKPKDRNERFVVVITGGLKDDRAFFEKILVPLLKSFGRKSVTISERIDYGAIEINFPDKDLFDRIRSYGFSVGKKGSNISIPSYFYANNLVKYVVAGFMATDGSLVLTKNPNKYYPRIEANSISKRLIEQIYTFLVSMGMNGAFYLAKRKKFTSKFRSNCEQYRFQFNGKSNLLIFHEKVGFANPRYEEKFVNFMKYEEEYESKIKNIPSQEQKFVRLNTLNGSEES